MVYETRPMTKREDRKAIAALILAILGCAALLLLAIEPVHGSETPKRIRNPILIPHDRPTFDQDADDARTCAGPDSDGIIPPRPASTLGPPKEHPGRAAGCADDCYFYLDDALNECSLDDFEYYLGCLGWMPWSQEPFGTQEECGQEASDIYTACADIAYWDFLACMSACEGIHQDEATLRECRDEVTCNSDADCDDGNTCTLDECGDGGTCTNTDIGVIVCPQNGSFCDGIESCRPSGGCISTGYPCLPGYVCNETTKECVFGECLVNRDCDDGNTCTNDVCVENGRGELLCDAIDTGTEDCPDDGTFCNGEEFCDELYGCMSCGNPCAGRRGTVCDEGADTCRSLCHGHDDCPDDGIDCTLALCLEGMCYTYTRDDECDDDNTCTINTCELEIGCVEEYRVRLYGDVHPAGGNDRVDGADIMCVATESAGGALCVGGGDIAGDVEDGCLPNGRCDLADVLAVIAAADGSSICEDPCPE